MDLSPTKKVVLTGAAALGIVLGAAGVTAAVTDTTSNTPSGVSSSQSGAQTTTANEANDTPDANEANDKADANEANDKADANDQPEANDTPDTARRRTETFRSGGLARAAAWASPPGQRAERACGAGEPSRDDVREPMHPQGEACDTDTEDDEHARAPHDRAHHRRTDQDGDDDRHCEVCRRGLGRVAGRKRSIDRRPRGGHPRAAAVDRRSASPSSSAATRQMTTVAR